MKRFTSVYLKNLTYIEPQKEGFNDLDLSHLILIKNPNNEIALGKNILSSGYCPDAKAVDILNTTGSEKIVTHEHYGTFNADPAHQFYSLERFYAFKIEILLIKYTVLFLSLVLVALDIKNIRSRIASQDEIVAEVFIS